MWVSLEFGLTYFICNKWRINGLENFIHMVLKLMTFMVGIAEEEQIDVLKLGYKMAVLFLIVELSMTIN